MLYFKVFMVVCINFQYFVDFSFVLQDFTYFLIVHLVQVIKLSILTLVQFILQNSKVFKFIQVQNVLFIIHQVLVVHYIIQMVQLENYLQVIIILFKEEEIYCFNVQVPFIFIYLKVLILLSLQGFLLMNRVRMNCYLI